MNMSNLSSLHSVDQPHFPTPNYDQKVFTRRVFSTPKEEWRPILGFEGKYDVSNYGEVRSVKTGAFLKKEDKKGYRRFEIFKPGERTRITAHRLVAIAFIPNPEGKPHINHKDGCKSNNYVGNLEWCTPQENVTHAIEVLGREIGGWKNVIRPPKGVIPPQLEGLWNGRSGDKHHRSKPVFQLDATGNFIARYESQNIASKITGVRQSAINKAVRGERKLGEGFIWRDDV